MKTIGERAARELRKDTGHAADRERDPDIDFRPSRAGQIEGQKCAEAYLHISDEEIGPVESAAALIADRAIEIAPPPAMLGNNMARSRGIIADEAGVKSRMDAFDDGSETIHERISRLGQAAIKPKFEHSGPGFVPARAVGRRLDGTWTMFRRRCRGSASDSPQSGPSAPESGHKKIPSDCGRSSLSIAAVQSNRLHPDEPESPLAPRSGPRRLASCSGTFGRALRTSRLARCGRAGGRGSAGGCTARLGRKRLA